MLLKYFEKFLCAFVLGAKPILNCSKKWHWKSESRTTPTNRCLKIYFAVSFELKSIDRIKAHGLKFAANLKSPPKFDDFFCVSSG